MLHCKPEKSVPYNSSNLKQLVIDWWTNSIFQGKTTEMVKQKKKLLEALRITFWGLFLEAGWLPGSELSITDVLPVVHVVTLREDVALISLFRDQFLYYLV